MSNANDRPASPLATNPSQERRIKVCQIPYEYQSKRNPPSPYSGIPTVPWIQLKGKWLEQAGFSIDTQIKVRVMNGCLVLTAQVQKAE